MSFYLSAIIIGLAGSFHCVGMCGPIAFALPINRKNQQSKIYSALLYSIGRLLAYGSIGVLMGYIGQGLYFSGIQRSLSIVIGVVLLLFVLMPKKWSAQLNSKMFSIPFFGWVRQSLSKLFTKKTYASIFSIGYLNGFLPCGLVYIALAGAIVTANPLEGAFFMMLFGLGTMPMMSSIVFFGAQISTNIRTKITKTIPVLMVLMAVVFILRGMNLGIPYLSPKYSDDCKTASCCKK
jgi:uncharacterized protein